VLHKQVVTDKQPGTPTTAFVSQRNAVTQRKPTNQALSTQELLTSGRGGHCACVSHCQAAAVVGAATSQLGVSEYFCTNVIGSTLPVQQQLWPVNTS